MLINLESNNLLTNMNFSNSIIKNCIIGKVAMIIFDYNNNIIIPEYITNLTIGTMNNYIDNLPINLKFLEIGYINYKLPLNNLPIGLKKLTICNDEVQYYDDIIKDYIIKKITIDDIKLPFGCELYICN